MAEKTCKKCAMTIPKAAKICPFCRKPQGWTLPAKIAGSFFAIMFLFALFGPPGNNSAQTTAPTAQDKVKEEKTTRAMAAALGLKRAMRNPDSFKLTSAILMDSGTACYQYRSQNGFGGMNSGRAVLPSKGDTIITDDMAGFNKKWEKQCAGKTGEDIVDYLDLMLK